MAEDKKPSKEDELFEFTSVIQLATAAMRDGIEGTTKHTDAVREEIAERKAAREEGKKATKSATDHKTAVEKSKQSFIALGKEIGAVVDAGIKLGSTLGTSATKGVELEIKNRLASVASVMSWNANLMVSGEQIEQAQKGFTDAFVGAREGFQVSGRGAMEFTKNLKDGFKSEFTPTAETFRVLTQMGMTTATQFDAFRRATGRASLSNNQLTALYNKNQLSFLLYGNSFAKAATNAERLGVNLASVQAAQEGLVTNLDGTIDTVAQMNQLGANIDFGNLVRIAEQEGPDALMAYVRATVPEQLMQSASTRSLFKQLGISVEDYMKSGQKQESAAAQLENQMTDAAKETNEFVKAITNATRAITTVWGAFGGLIKAVFGVVVALKVLGIQGIGTLLIGMKTSLATFATGLAGALAPALLPLAGLAIAAAAVYGAFKLFQKADKNSSVVGRGITGATAGALLGAGLGTALTVATGGALAPSIPMLAAAGAGLGGTYSIATGGDVVSVPGQQPQINREGTFIDKLNSAILNRSGTPNKTPMVGGNMLGNLGQVLSTQNKPRMRTMDDGVSAPGAGVRTGAKGSLLGKAVGLGGAGSEAAQIARTAYLTTSMRARLLASLSKTRGLGLGNLVGGILDGTQMYAESREKGKSVSDSVTRGAIMGTATGTAGLGAGLLAASIVGGVGAAPLVAGLLASMAVGYGTRKLVNSMLGDDVLSTPAGYGERILLTPQGPIALNNKDTVMAFADDMVNGTTRLPLGYFAGMMGGAAGNTSSLTKKMDELISTISTATTVVNVGGTTKTVPRMQLTGVYSRNER